MEISDFSGVALNWPSTDGATGKINLTGGILKTPIIIKRTVF